jgi:hypothetical protein
MFVTLLASSLLFTQATPSPAPSPTPQAEAPPPERDRQICRRERRIGSNRFQRICVTAKERDAQRDASRDVMQQVEGRGGVSEIESGRGI